jgi:hypothetical protein
MSNASDFRNDATQRERREIVKNERKLRQGERQSTTYHAQAMAGLDEPGGRFANQARYVTGSEAAVNYPASSPPWHAQADPGIEPPTGVAIDAMEPCGEQFEIERSLEELGGPEPGAGSQSRVPNQELKSALEGSGSPPSLVEAQSPLEVVTPALSVETASAIPSMMKRRKLV